MKRTQRLQDRADQLAAIETMRDLVTAVDWLLQTPADAINRPYEEQNARACADAAIRFLKQFDGRPIRIRPHADTYPLPFQGAS